MLVFIYTINNDYHKVNSLKVNKYRLKWWSFPKLKHSHSIDNIKCSNVQVCTFKIDKLKVETIKWTPSPFHAQPSGQLFYLWYYTHTHTHTHIELWKKLVSLSTRGRVGCKQQMMHNVLWLVIVFGLYNKSKEIEEERES